MRFSCLSRWLAVSLVASAIVSAHGQTRPNGGGGQAPFPGVVFQSGTTAGITGTNSITATNRSLQLYNQSAAGSATARLVVYDTITNSTSNVWQRVGCEFETAGTSAGTVFITNGYFWPALAGTNQATTFIGSIEGTSLGGTVSYYTTTPVIFTITNGVTQGFLAGNTGAWSGTSAPGTAALVKDANGWSFGLTPASSTATHVTVWGELHHRYN